MLLCTTYESSYTWYVHRGFPRSLVRIQAFLRIWEILLIPYGYFSIFFLISQLFYQLHHKWNHTCDDCYSNDRNNPCKRNSWYELVSDPYQDESDHKWKESESDKSQWESDDTKDRTEDDIHYREDNSEYESTRISMLESNARNITRIREEKYGTSRKYERNDIIHNLQEKMIYLTTKIV